MHLPAGPNQVAYICAKGGGSWSPGAFAVELLLTSGSAGCSREQRTSATVKVNDKPTVTALPPTAPVTICEDSQEPFVEVEFTVQADTTDDITVPNKITNGSRVCTAQTGGPVQGSTFVGEFHIPMCEACLAANGCQPVSLSESIARRVMVVSKQLHVPAGCAC
jgi:hypothetical protein